MSTDVGKSNTSRLHLPRIGHRMSKFESASLNNSPRASYSRASSIGDVSIKNFGLDNSDLTRPIKIDDGMFFRSKKLAADSSLSMSNDIVKIPDQVQAVFSGDPNKVSIPVFDKSSKKVKPKANFQIEGSRPGTSNSFLNSSTQSLSNLELKTKTPSLDEYLATLRDKIRNNPYEIRTKFRNVDADHGSKGISREALAHIIASLLGPTKPLSHANYLKILDRLGLKDKPVIRYDEFLSAFQEKMSMSSSADQPDWLDPIRSSRNSYNNPVTRKATQVIVILKEKAKLKSSDLVRLVPYLNSGILGNVFKPELMNCISSMGIKMEPEEFEKLWKKFDADAVGFVKADVFLKKLGLSVSDFAGSASHQDSPNSERLSVPVPNLSEEKLTNNYGEKKKSSSKSSSKKNPMDRWLKKKFRDGFIKMKASFEEIDLQKTGQVRRDQFLRVLRQHNLNLEDTLLDAFLERCGLPLPNHSTLIAYKEFLEKFQSRNDSGIAYRFIRNGDFDEERALSQVGQAEKRLIKAFQNDFLGLLQTFRKIDRYKSNTISKQEFRAAIESHFGIELTDDEFNQFVKDAPIDASNRVQYLEFMTRFDSDTSNSLFDSQSIRDDDFQPRLAKKPDYDTINEENENWDYLEKSTYKGRSLSELQKVIKKKIKDDYKSIETAWNQVDTLNSNEMSKDMMYEMFKRLKMSPPVTRDEIDLLWTEFILKDNKKLEYWQFVRHFGFSKRSACYENAKKAPPKRGDNDVMLTSNKLGRDSILIRGSVQSKLIMQFDNLKRSFEDLDPYRTDLLLREEFEETLLELCPELNKQEMDFICSKYESDGRINYMEFLTPYNPKKYTKISTSDRLNQTENLASSRLDMNDTLLIKLRSRLSEHYKEMRRIFKQHDFNQSGFVPIGSFKETLNSKIRLSEDEMYDLLRRLDRDMTGSINYNKFINDIIKP